MSLADGKRVRCSARSGSDATDRAFEAILRAEFLKSPYAEIRAVSCHMNEGVLTLTGLVPSYYLKQVAQRLALDLIRDAAEIANQLRVEP